MSKGSAEGPPATQARAGAQRPPAAAGPPGLPLDGVVVAFTGELDTLARPDAEERGKRLHLPL